MLNTNEIFLFWTDILNFQNQILKSSHTNFFTHLSYCIFKDTKFDIKQGKINYNHRRISMGSCLTNKNIGYISSPKLSNFIHCFFIVSFAKVMNLIPIWVFCKWYS